MDVSSASERSLREEELSTVGKLLGELARDSTTRRFEVAPNPCVGAAVLSGGRVIATGFHDSWGGSHAEVNALEAAAKSGQRVLPEDALVITLEPCSSQGKTPPCTEAILRSGIRRVIVGEIDPDPRHRGRGIEALRQRGIEVLVLPGPARLAEVAPHFLRWTDADRLRRPRPWTIAKWAQTRTGQLQPPAEVGGGRWISGPLALAEVQVLRGRVDALLTGVSTVRADDPRLTVRLPGDPTRPPLRAVLDTELRTPPQARILQPAGPHEAGGEVVIFCRRGADPARHRTLEKAGARVQPVQAGEDGRPLCWEVVRWLWEHGVQRLCLESGPTILSAWFEAELVDQVRVYTGNVNGGRGPSLAERLERRRLAGVSFSEVGGDARLDAFVRD